MLRKIADLKTLLWMIASTSLFIYQWNEVEFHWVLYILYLYFSVSFSIFAHNHNHNPVWKNDFLNQIHSCWITVFYGFPLFAWIPIHNRNHHKYNNKEDDYTKTYTKSEENNLFTLLSYPSINAMVQQKAAFRYYFSLFANDKLRFFYCSMQIITLLTWIIVGFVIDWQKALIFIVIPQQVSLNTVLIFNYIQHVHANEESRYNHSRNFVSWTTNFFLFNNGYHTVHHNNPNLHWSELPPVHEEIKDNIDPVLNEAHMSWYLIRVYILGLIIPRYRTSSMRLERLKQV